MPNDFVTTMRKLAFHKKLGLFNPKQLFLQGSAVVATLSIAPRHGLRAGRALPGMIMGLFIENPDHIRALGKKMSRISGWDAGEFADMMDSYKKSGFATMQGDLAYIDDIKPSRQRFGGGRVRRGARATGDFLSNQGTVFYKSGESINRSMAYATAWSEWKARNPGAKLSRRAETDILQRAKNLTTNMTRDSNAAWQRGGLSMATQFMGYQARFMEIL